MYKCKGTLLVFRTGKFRAMGKNMSPVWINNLDVTIYQCLPQSMTITYDLCREVNLNKLRTVKYYKPELFNGMKIMHDSSFMINVFSSDGVLLLGVKSWNYVLEKLTYSVS